MHIVSNIRQWQVARRRRRIMNALPRRILEDIGAYDYRGR